MKKEMSSEDPCFLTHKRNPLHLNNDSAPAHEKPGRNRNGSRRDLIPLQPWRRLGRSISCMYHNGQLESKMAGSFIVFMFQWEVRTGTV